MQLVLDVSDARQGRRQHDGQRPICPCGIQLSLCFIQMRAAVAAIELGQEIRVGEAGVQRIGRLRIERIEALDGGGELLRADLVVGWCSRFRFSRERQRRASQNPSEQECAASGFPRAQELLRMPL